MIHSRAKLKKLAANDTGKLFWSTVIPGAPETAFPVSSASSYQLSTVNRSNPSLNNRTWSFDDQSEDLSPLTDDSCSPPLLAESLAFPQSNAPPQQSQRWLENTSSMSAGMPSEAGFRPVSMVGQGFGSSRSIVPRPPDQRYTPGIQAQQYPNQGFQQGYPTSQVRRPVAPGSPRRLQPLRTHVSMFPVYHQTPSTSKRPDLTIFSFI
jgi:hypothetical protein